MKTADFDYYLPHELIAQEPLKNRTAARLLALGKTIDHKTFSDIEDYLQKNDVLVLNNTRVIPARLYGKKKTGGTVEILLVKKMTQKHWTCLVRGKNLVTGTELSFDNDIIGKLTRKNNDFEIQFNKPTTAFLQELGNMPTPPYIKKKLQNGENYNTVFAQKEGSIAAPTAGLHFTKELLKKIQQKGIKIVFVTLHVGLGTFLPVKEEDITKHHMHEEHFEISKKTADTINKRKGNLFVVGTTTLRSLETKADTKGKIKAGKGTTNIFIYPPYQFKLKFDALITNFHLPKSTLLMLVSAIAGKERILQAYKIAIQEKYRFFSFGDAMLILSFTQNSQH